MSHRIPESELILNPDGSVYHLHLLPADIADHIITVGDPDRVDDVASRLDTIRITKQKREFKTITGTIGGRDITIISTGIGTDNIDIVFTELDILANVDLKTRLKAQQHRKLHFYRLGTSGALRDDIAIDSIVISAYAIGLEGLMHYYQYQEPDVPAEVISEEATYWLKDRLSSITPYTAKASQPLQETYGKLGRQGITVTATGFYGPQGRKVIASPRHRTFLDDMAKLKYGSLQVTNLEMETAGIYGMAHLLGHEAISLNAILANRVTQDFSANPKAAVSSLIDRFFDLFLKT